MTSAHLHESDFDPAVLLQVLTAVKKGDFSTRMPLDWTGVNGKIADTLNDIIDINDKISTELDRVSNAAGKEGKLAQRVSFGAVDGAWAVQGDSINTLISDLAMPTNEMARVIGAVAKGDLTQRVSLDADGKPMRGEFMRTAKIVNTMVAQLESFSSEVTRVAREVGTEGKLGGQAQVKGVLGTWKDLTDNVNAMAGNLTVQLRDVSKVATAIAQGDLTQKITVDVKGEILQIKDVINTMVDQLGSFASEVTRVAREVGSEGKLGGQAQVQGVAGTWKDLTDNVNSMAGNLTVQLRDVSKVATAIAQGDLGQKITVDVKGEILQIKNVINTMVDQLGSFASEVTRVAREVGTDGKLGGQARVEGVAGTWKDLTDNVNSMAGNLTSQVRNIAEVTTAVANGNLSKKITVNVKGEIMELKNTINTMVDQLGSFASEVTRVAREVGTDGKLGGQAQVQGVAGTWKDLTDNVNSMAGNLTSQVRNIAEVTTAVANGNLSKKITVNVKGEIMELKNTINTMVDQLGSFASEVTRVAREVGTDGKLGGQAEVEGVSGTWKDLTDNVNLMASNLTGQVRGIARVVTAVAEGDLNKKLTVDAKGEIASLADTINNMIDTLAIFADQVTSVAREVGVEGKLGGQARVPGASGTWKDLTDNVNQLAANLTAQVRAIAEVATAVTKGDLTRSIGVAAEGEVAVLKDTINEMIRNLKDTTDKNTEQDWLKTNLTRFTRILQGQREMLTVCKLILSELAPLVNAQHGVFYGIEGEHRDARLALKASYAYRARESLPRTFALGEGLVGECALEKERILLTNVPSDYIKINSGVGEASPLNIVVLPVMFEGQTKAVIELASFERFSPTHLSFLEQLTESIGIVLNTIEANSRTEGLLSQSQKMAEELRDQQEELQQTNEELEEKAQLLSAQNIEVERKNREVEIAKQSLEEKAAQLSLTSKYKSEFLANMSHELRTPLNSLLLLAQQLRDNPDQNLSGKQVEYAKTIFASGHDLLNLINDILDLSKIESGTVTADIGEVAFSDLDRFVQQTFQHMAEDKKLDFAVELGGELPSTILTDERRLKQIAKNLLSNAFKFTAHGYVKLRVELVTGGWGEHTGLSRADHVVAFSVSDSGIGISADKQRVIFEAFQQADGTTSRKYGGTGLGLAISRELARLLGGQITLKSLPGKGSRFTLYLPLQYRAASSANLPARVDELPSPEHTRELAELTSGTEGAATPGMGDDSLRPSAVPKSIDDDRLDLQAEERVMLIGEDDPNLAKTLLGLAHERGLKGIVANQAQTALSMARQYAPDLIVLNLSLPGMSGWGILDHLKHDPETRHIPVFLVARENDVHAGLRLGALGSMSSPVKQEALDLAIERSHQYAVGNRRDLLLVETKRTKKQDLADLLRSSGVTITTTDRAGALESLGNGHFDCLVIDLSADVKAGLELLETLGRNEELSALPIVAYRGEPEALDDAGRRQLEALSQTLVLAEVDSRAWLLDQVTLFLHLREMDLMDFQQEALEHIRRVDPRLAGRKVLIVDDDIRNIFSLTAFLEQHQMEVLSAENGKSAIAQLENRPDIEIVLMDIMMPEMDGYETTRAVRSMPDLKTLPVIALTAKAMPGDREKCIEVGASDYIPKPVNTAQLLALLRVWLAPR
ncbi:HAMP domain-containing protein [Marinobacter fonticola]|uniref:HAMP domain-containing protein n=1 Tax=Marinobacter fonticola TaxID=2603215 RepID=UPI0011E6FF2A|nr:HAMP domain-containing protein [Marinobacter fonticola]